jgi:hypothetical protein
MAELDQYPINREHATSRRPSPLRLDYATRKLGRGMVKLPYNGLCADVAPGFHNLSSQNRTAGIGHFLPAGNSNVKT